MPTPHIAAAKEDIAPLVIMPGDPLRAKFIAEHFLERYCLVSDIRNMYAFTGYYKGKRVTVMGSGMGMPSIGIYSYELFKFYDVQRIIRVGTSGSYTSRLKLYDMVLCNSAYTESTFAYAQNGEQVDTKFPHEGLNQKIQEVASNLEYPLNLVKVHSSDVFYHQPSGTDFRRLYQELDCWCVDMESYALFHNAEVLGKEAACILTISDSLVSGEETTPQERQSAFVSMMEIALEAIIQE